MLRSQNYATQICFSPLPSPVVTPLQIDFVPDLNFTTAAKRSHGFSGRLQLSALFDAQGMITEIRPHAILPSGVPESAAGRGVFAGYTAMMVDGQFVRELPFDLSNNSIEQLRRIRFTPSQVGSQPMTQRVIVDFEYHFFSSPAAGNAKVGNRFNFVTRDAPGEAWIELTLMDEGGSLWQGMWRNDNWLVRPQVPRSAVPVAALPFQIE
jgi:hypothetical protein